MSEREDPVRPEGADDHEHATGGSHKGLVFGAAVLASVGTILAGVYGIRAGQAGALVLKALALDGVLVSLSAWLALHAFRIRRRLADAHQWHEREERGSRGPQGWDEPDEDEINVTLHDVYHSRMIHFAVLAVPVTAIVGLLSFYLLWTQSGAERVLVPPEDIPATSVICLVVCCLWLVLSRSFEAFVRDDLPEARSLMLAFRDLQWTTLLVAAGVLGTKLWPKSGFWGDGEPWSPPEMWVARAILVWLVAVSLEQIARIVLAWLRREWVDEGFVSPTQLVLREAVFVRGNPIASLFETIEARFGVSFRSSWAIRFVRAAAVPSLIAVLLLFWGLTSLSIVPVDELGVRESFGRIRGDLLPASVQSKLGLSLGQLNDEPLAPGLHLKLPWPFGRIRHYPVKKVFTKPIGFIPSVGRQRAYLWTKAHAEEEFALVLGNDAQVVAINALVYYKIREDKQGFLDYVYQYSDSPDDGPEASTGRAQVEGALNAYAHRALMEQTRSATIEQILSTNRAEFTHRLTDSLRAYSDENHFGIDVINVALVVIHPPAEAAKEYLDVISAGIEAQRMKIQAEGDSVVTIQNAQTQSATSVAQAQVEASEQVGQAYKDSAEPLALGKAYAVAPESFKQRLWFEAQEETLGGKPLVIVDQDIIVDMRPEVPPLNIIPSGVQ
jgi:regulator of protease activity HflC (stomatin/prohibitin superfamily)